MRRLRFYYLGSRYYDPEVGRFISADGLLDTSSILGYNLFAYCFNNSVNMCDSTGYLPKWITGTLNIIGGTIQVGIGVALGATVGWTGVGAVVAGFLIINGAATVLQGVGQVVNDVTETNVLREDNVIRTCAQEIGGLIGGDSGKKSAGTIYDTTVVVANLYVGKFTAQQAGLLPIKVELSQIVNNPFDEFVTLGPAQGVISNYCKTIPYTGYGKITAVKLINGLYQLTNGHHRVAALRSLGKKTIWIFLSR